MFARGFFMQAFSDDERMFPSFRDCFAPGVLVADIARRGWPVFVGVDLAGDKRPGNVIFVAALDPVTKRRYPLEVLAGAWRSPETAARIADVNARYPVKVIVVENNAYQQSLVDWIRHSCRDFSFWAKVEAFTTGKNKADKNYGLPSLEIELKNRAWVIPSDEFGHHPMVCRCGWCVWRREAEDYPMAANTDAVMSWWFCREAIDKWGSVAGLTGASLGDINSR